MSLAPRRTPRGDGLLVERFNANGSPDTSFGSGGVVSVLSGSRGDGYGVAIQSNGDIVASGAASPAAVPNVAVVRLRTNGAPDSSFGSGGVDLLDLGAYSIAQAVALQANGDIAIVGSQSPGLQATNALIARLSPSGGLDSGFAGTGCCDPARPGRRGVCELQCSRRPEQRRHCRGRQRVRRR